VKRYQGVILIGIAAAIITIAGEVCVALFVMWAGVIDVGADHPHPQFVQWYLDHGMTNSVRRHAKGIQAPPQAQVSMAEGAGHYSDVCAICHGAPGVERSAIGEGLSPDPPHLTRTANDWTVEQVYWLATHGVGDTGMPAFGATRTEQQRWAIAWFVKQLPSMTPAEFRRLVAENTSQNRQP
jgi:mono/diheme cytochrome c family protein